MLYRANGNHFTHRPFAELHCTSNLRFHAEHRTEELVQQAHKLGYEAIAITDECSYSSLVKAANRQGLRYQADLRAEFILDETFVSRMPVRQTVDAGWFYWRPIGRPTVKYQS